MDARWKKAEAIAMLEAAPLALHQMRSRPPFLPLLIVLWAIASGAAAGPPVVTNATERQAALDTGAKLVMPHLKKANSDPKLTEASRSQLREGIEYLRAVTNYNPRDWPAYFFIGKAYQALGDNPLAYEAFRSAYTIYDKNADVAREFGLACIDLGFAEPAIEAMKRAIGLTPDDAGLYANLALAYLIAGKNDDALSAVNKSVEMNPADAISRNARKLIIDVMAGKRNQPKSAAEF